MNQPENWGAYPEPHYDEYGDCQCPDHQAMRDESPYNKVVRAFIEREEP